MIVGIPKEIKVDEFYRNRTFAKFALLDFTTNKDEIELVVHNVISQILMKDIIHYIIALVVGVCGSLIASLLFLRWMEKYKTPRLQISSKISKQQQASSGCEFVYRAKFYNVGKTYIAKATASGRVYFPIKYKRPGQRKGIVFHIDIPVIECEWWNIPPKEKKYGKIPVLDLDDKNFLKNFSRYNFPDEIKAKAGSAKLDLEIILKYATSLEINLSASNTVGLTTVVSQKYKIEDIIQGEFKEGELDVIPEKGQT